MPGIFLMFWVGYPVDGAWFPLPNPISVSGDWDECVCIKPVGEDGSDIVVRGTGDVLECSWLMQIIEMFD